MMVQIAGEMESECFFVHDNFLFVHEGKLDNVF